MHIKRLVGLFTAPDIHWPEVLKNTPGVVSVYIQYLLPLTLLPVFSLYFGLTEIGWKISGNKEAEHLTAESAIIVCMGAGISTMVGVCVMAQMIRWMSQTYEANPSFSQCVVLTAHTITPLLIFGAAGLYPQLWFLSTASLLAITWSVYLLFKSVPKCMNIPFGQGFVFSCSIICVGLVGLISLFVFSIIAWEMGFEPVHL